MPALLSDSDIAVDSIAGPMDFSIGDDWVDVPQFLLEVDGVPVTLAVYSRGDEHLAPGSRAEPDGPQRARLAEVEALLQA